LIYAPVRMLSESLVPDDPLSPSSTPESQGAGPNQILGEYHGDAPSRISSFDSLETGTDSSGSGISDGAELSASSPGGCQGSDAAPVGSLAVQIGGGANGGVGAFSPRNVRPVESAANIKAQKRPERIELNRGASLPDAGIVGEQF
jgi:hypothetical protein